MCYDDQNMKKVKFQTDNGSIIEPKDVKPSRAEEGLRLAEVDKLRADVNDVKGMTEGLRQASGRMVR